MVRRVMAVAFEPHGRLYYLDPGDADHAVGAPVLFPAEHGPEVARCVWGPTQVDWDDGELPLCGGPATEEDLRRDAANRVWRAEIRAVAERLIVEHELAMTVVGVDFVDRSPEADRVAVIYFKAPHRVDFRLLLGDLARALACRIDLRQVGSRDVATLLGGVGVCGRELCCCAMKPLQEPLPGRVTREQEVANQALQYAGACGRLKCCLAYEQQTYLDFLADAPQVGSVVDTPAGEGVVSGHAVPADAVWVRTEDGLRAIPVADARVLRPPPGQPRSARPGGRSTPPSPRSPAEPADPPLPRPPGKPAARLSVFPLRDRRREPEQ